MTDLEMTKLCAEAMGGFICDSGQLAFALPDIDTAEFKMIGCITCPFLERYDPLHEDALAMALAKRLMLCIDFFVGSACSHDGKFITYNDESINRAIVECVAKMRAARTEVTTA